MMVTENDIYTLSEFRENRKTSPIRRHLSSFLWSTDEKFVSVVSRLKIKKSNFIYLLRKVILLKYSTVGFHVREFYSEDLTRIFMVLKAQNTVLLEWAEVSYALLTIVRAVPHAAGARLLRPLLP